MPRVSIPVTAPNRAGVAQPVQTDADHTNNMQLASNDGHTILEIASTDASPQTVTFEIPNLLVDGQAVAPKPVVVGAGNTVVCGPWPTNIYNQAGGELFIDVPVSTTLKFRAYTSAG